MLVECIREFRDIPDKRVLRKVGERFEVDEKRFAAINATRYGQLVKNADGSGNPEKPKKVKGRPKKDDLMEQAAALGIEVPEGATNPEIAKLIKEAEE